MSLSDLLPRPGRRRAPERAARPPARGARLHLHAALRRRAAARGAALARVHQGPARAPAARRGRRRRARRASSAPRRTGSARPAPRWPTATYVPAPVDRAARGAGRVRGVPAGARHGCPTSSSAPCSTRSSRASTRSSAATAASGGCSSRCSSSSAGASRGRCSISRPSSRATATSTTRCCSACARTTSGCRGCTFFAVGVHETAERATRQARALIRHYERDREKVKGHALRLADELFRTPCMTVPEAQRMLDVDRPHGAPRGPRARGRGLLAGVGREALAARVPGAARPRRRAAPAGGPAQRSGRGRARHGGQVGGRAGAEAAAPRRPPHGRGHGHHRRGPRARACSSASPAASPSAATAPTSTSWTASTRTSTSSGCSDQRKEIHAVFEELGYTENRYVTQSTDSGQLQYIKNEALEGMKAEAQASAAGRPAPYEPPLVDHIDIFLDVMRMDHDIDVQRAARDRRLRHLAGRRASSPRCRSARSTRRTSTT